MSSLEDLERRMAALEAQLALVRQDVASVRALEAQLALVRREAVGARALAAGADHDVAEYRAELRGHTRMLTALRETQVEHYAEHKADSAELRTGVAELRAGVAELKAGVAQIVGLLDHLVDRDNGRE